MSAHKGPRSQTIVKMQQAALLRAQAKTWEQVALELHVSINLVKHYPSMHPQLWETLYAKATDDLYGERVAQAIDVMTRNMDDKANPQLAQRAASDFLTFYLGNKKIIEGTKVQVSAYADPKGMTQEEIDAEILAIDKSLANENLSNGGKSS